MPSSVLEKPVRIVTRTVLAPAPLFHEMERLTREIEERAFHLFAQRGGVHGSALTDWLQAESDLVTPLSIELKEYNNEIIIRAEAPGFELRDLTVVAESSSVMVYGKAGKRREEEKKRETKRSALHHYTEINSNEIFRKIYLPADINPDQVTAQTSKGVLEIHLPKATQQQDGSGRAGVSN